MSIGVVKIGGKPVNPSYGFRWLTSGAVRDRKLRGEKAPIVVCQAHTEAIYIAAYKKRIPVGLYTGDRVQNMIPEVKDAKDLAVLRDGSISAINPAEE
jgi:hypothetical protein